MSSIVRIANSEDEPLIRKCLRDNPMPGAISVSFETEPNFFNAVSVQGKENQVIVGKTAQENLIGFGVRAIKPVYVNGAPQDVGYFSNLRINENFRKQLFLFRGFQFLKELDEDNRVPFYLTTIIDDNVEAKKVLEKNGPNMPNYTNFGLFHTYLITPKKKSKSTSDIVRGGNVSLEKILEFMNSEGSKKQFYPEYLLEDFDNGFLRGLNQEDFYVDIQNGEIRGVVASWDQLSFKQTRISSYNALLKAFRPVLNVASSFFKLPFLPSEGELLNSFYASFPTVKDNDPEIFEGLLKAISEDENTHNYSCFSLGLHSSDPLSPIVDKIASMRYDSRLYVVSFDKEDNNIENLKGEIPYLELGTL